MSKLQQKYNNYINQFDQSYIYYVYYKTGLRRLNLHKKRVLKLNIMKILNLAVKILQLNLLHYYAPRFVDFILDKNNKRTEKGRILLFPYVRIKFVPCQNKYIHTYIFNDILLQMLLKNEGNCKLTFITYV